MTRTSTRNADPAVTALTAVDEYVAAYSGLIADASVNGVAVIDATTADTAVTAAFDAWSPGSAAPVVAAAHLVLDGWTEQAEGALAGLPGRSIGEAMARRFQAQLGAVTAAADHVLSDCTFDRQDELDTATADLAAAQGDLAKSRATLEDAVDRGDIDTVMTLRTIVEVEAPARIATLTATVLDIEVAQAQHRRANPERRAATAAVRADKAQTAVMAAHEQLATAQREAGAANLAKINADSDLAAHDRAIATATATRDAHAARHAQAQRAALRRLAGLPAETATPAAVDDEGDVTLRPDVSALVGTGQANR